MACLVTMAAVTRFSSSCCRSTETSSPDSGCGGVYPPIRLTMARGGGDMANAAATLASSSTSTVTYSTPSCRRSSRGGRASATRTDAPSSRNRAVTSWPNPPVPPSTTILRPVSACPVIRPPQLAPHCGFIVPDARSRDWSPGCFWTDHGELVARDLANGGRHAHRGTRRRVVGDDGGGPDGRPQRLHRLGPRPRTGPGDLRTGRQL